MIAVTRVIIFILVMWLLIRGLEFHISPIKAAYVVLTKRWVLLFTKYCEVNFIGLETLCIYFISLWCHFADQRENFLTLAVFSVTSIGLYRQLSDWNFRLIQILPWYFLGVGVNLHLYESCISADWLCRHESRHKL